MVDLFTLYLFTYCSRIINSQVS